MNSLEELKRNFNAEDGTFLLKVRCDLKWDQDAFREMVRTMLAVANDLRGAESVPTWVANGFWYCDTWLKSWVSHPGFPGSSSGDYEQQLTLVSDLAYLLFNGESPYEDETLERNVER